MSQNTDLAGKFLLRVIVLSAIVGGFLLWASGAFAAHDQPGEWSLRGLASWSAHIGSGTALPAVASWTTGDLFAVYDNVTDQATPTLYRLAPSGWERTGDYYTQAETDATITAAIAADPGVATHSDLANLSFADSGHTGFASEAALADYYTITQVDATLTAAIASIPAGGVATHSELANLAYADSGHTGFEKLVASGTALPATDTYALGDLFLVVDPATTTVLLYCLSQGPSIIGWNPIAGVGLIGVATLTHNELENLSFATSGHTGFASSGELLDYYRKSEADATITAAITEAGIGGGAGDPTLQAAPPAIVENVGQTWVIATDSSGVYWHCLESCGNGIVLGGDNNAKIYRSLDYGRTWGLASLTSVSVIDSITYCGSGTLIAGTGGSGIILRSLDYGSTWALASDTAAATIYSVISCGQGIVLAFSGATGIIYRSTNYGSTWAIATDTTETSFRSAAYCGGGRVVAGGTATGAIWLSTDYGTTWTTATETSASIVSSMVYLGGGVVLAGGENTKRVYRSTDSGSTWTTTAFVASGAVSCFANVGGGVVAMGEGSTAIIYISTDYGVNWALVENIAQTRIDSLCHVGYGVLLAGTDSNAVLYRSADAYSPALISPAACFPSLATPTGPLLATGTQWYDSNSGVNKVKVWDGAAWQSLW